MKRTSDHTAYQDDVALDLKGIVAAIWRRRLFILLFTVLVALAAFVTLTVLPPRYQAETKLLIEQRDISLVNTQGQASDQALLDQEYVASQVQLLMSRDLARGVAQTFKLTDRAEFQTSALLPRLLASIGVTSDPSRASPEERMIDTFMEHLEVFRVDGSRVIVVRFSSRDSRLAADVANAVVAEYMRLQGQAKRGVSTDRLRWLGEEVGRLEEKVKGAEAAVEDYRARNGLVAGDSNATPGRQQISNLINAVAAARADLAAARSKADLLDGVLKRGSGLEAASEVLSSDTFRALRSREIALRSKLSELSVTLLSGHPQVRAVQSQVDDIMRQETAEARRILASLGNDAKVAEGRIASLNSSLEKLKAGVTADSQSEVELRALERDAASQRALLEGLLARYREATARQSEDATPADARVISVAMMPSEPAFPRVLPLTIVITLAAFLLAIGYVFTAEFASGRALVPIEAVGRSDYQPVPEVATIVDIPQDVAKADAIAEGDTGAVEPADPMPVEARPEVMDRRVQRFRERIGHLTAGETARVEAAVHRVPGVMSAIGLQALFQSNGVHRASIASLTAVTDGQWLTATLAHRLVEIGLRVVIVQAAQSSDVAGLGDLLHGDVEFADIIHRNPANGAHEITAGRLPFDRLWAERASLADILEALEQTYDLVLIDLGLLRSDPAIAAFMEDGAGHVVLVGTTDDQSLLLARNILIEQGVSNVSLVAAPVDAAVGAVA